MSVFTVSEKFKMKIILYEIKKSWFKFSILFLLIIFCFINIYKFTSVYNFTGRFRGNSDIGMRNAYYTFYEIYSGEITDDKIKNASENYNRITMLANAENNITEYDKNSISGHIYGDYITYSAYVIPELEYAITYPNKASEICKSAYENILFYSEHNNYEDTEKNKYIYRLYQNRKVEKYNLTEWVKLYFEYDFSSLLIIIMIIIGLASCFSTETESGMITHLKSGGKLAKIVNAKFISAAIYIFLLIVFFTICDLVIVNSLCGMDGIFNPIYSADFFGTSPFGFSLFTAIITCVLGKYLAFLVIGEIVILISVISKNSVLSLCGSFLVIILLMLTANENSAIINPVNMLLVYKMLEKFDCKMIFGKPVLSLYIALAIYFIVIIALFFIIKICTVGVKRRNLSAKT